MSARSIRQIAGQPYPQPFDATRIGVDHLEFDAAFMRHDLATRWHPSGADHHQTAQSVDVLVVVVHPQGHAKRRFKLIQRRGGLSEENAGILLIPQIVLSLVMFIFDLADHGFDQILDRHQPVDPTIFIDDEGHMDPFALHFLQ